MLLGAQDMIARLCIHHKHHEADTELYERIRKEGKKCPNNQIEKARLEGLQEERGGSSPFSEYFWMQRVPW